MAIDFYAIQSKMSPIEIYLSRRAIEVVQEEVVVAKIMEGFLPTPSKPTYFFVKNERKDEF